MSVKCIDCNHANWQLTATGRIKKTVRGRCDAVIPEPIKIMCAYRNDKPHKGAIWPDHSGECDLFEAKP